MKSTLEPITQESELIKVRRWRHEQIEKLGFEGVTLEALVETSVDLHYLTHLIHDLGYTPSQVGRLIL
jgi:hypothetical protein